MTTDQIILKLGEQAKKIKVLRDDNRRIWESREEWKQKHRACARENTALRRRVSFLEDSRDMWRNRAPSPRTSRPTPNVWLTGTDLDRIMEMPARD